VLLVILPLASSYLTKRYGYDALRRDLYLSRVSVVLVVTGGFMLAFAAVPWLLVSSLIVTSMGIGFTMLCRALLNAVVEPHTVATLNTTISTMETLMGLVGAPLGLPYLVTAICSALVLVAVFAFRIPAGFAQAQL